MEKRKNNYGLKILLVVLAFLLGASLMYGVVKKYPKFFELVKIEKDVTVTDAGIADAVEKVYDAVVVVSNYKDNNLYSTGTGFVYKKEKGKAYILTNNHVVAGGNKVTVTFTNGDIVETDVIGTDLLSDIAVLALPDDKIISISEIGKSDKMRIGDTTFAVGAPLNSAYSWTVTRGIVSGKDRMIEITLSNQSGEYVMKAIQTDAAINSGNSGGPLCNSNGEVIGITSMKLVDTSVEGMGFAIPIEVALKYADILENGKTITQPYLGVQMLNLTSAYGTQFAKLAYDSGLKSGVIIAAVEAGSPAGKAGIKARDILIKMNDKEVSSIGYLRYYLYGFEVGQKVNVTVVREGKEKNITVTLGSNNSATY